MREIEEIAFKGAENYYQYLNRTNKGREIISVRAITRNGLDYLIHIAKNPFSIDSVLFVVRETELDPTHLVVHAHDRDGRILFVRVARGRNDPLLGIPPEQLQIVSDMKFLVLRVKNWYEHNEDTLNFPSPKPVLEINGFLQADLSDHQRIAVKSIFTNSPSYVWGAPGTGKTRYVLSECLLQYCVVGRQVIVLAPTNNSLEQVLYGVLEKLEHNNIPRNDIIRLGTPSLKFAEAFGEICEVQGVEKRLRELRDQIIFYKKVLNFRSFVDRLSLAENEILPLFSELHQSLIEMKELGARLASTTNLVLEAERLLQAIEANHLLSTRSVVEQQRRMQSPLYKLGTLFSNALETNAESKLQSLLNAENSSVAQFSAAQLDFERYKAAQKSCKEELLRLDIVIDANMKRVVGKLCKIDAFHEIMKGLNRTNVDQYKNRLADEIARGQAYKVEAVETFSFFNGMENSEIEQRITEIQIQHDRIAVQSTEERLTRVKIVAATIDTFLFRYQTNQDDDTSYPVTFHHIFLDEAGYCPLAKSLALFGFHRPVTLFGDHMQLPPVCEANESEIRLAENENVFLFAQSSLFVEDAFQNAEHPELLLTQYLHHKNPMFNMLSKSDLNETYRFGEKLARILDDWVYKNHFRSANPTTQFTIEILDAPKTYDAQPRQNIAEADIISDRLAFLGTDDYAILAPYKNQVRLLAHKLPESNNEQRIMTVHASQGREWDTVILSVVDTNNMYFTDTRRIETGGLQIMNTAISRAKSRLIIACDLKFWSEQDNQMIHALVTDNNFLFE